MYKFSTYDIEMSFECGDHQARIIIFIRDMNVCRVICQIFDNVEPSVETGGSYRCRVCFCRMINIRASFYQCLHHVQVPYT